MIITNKTISILKTFSQINPSIKFIEGNKLLSLHNRSKIFSEATVTETFPMKCGIWDLPQFLNVIGMFENPNLEFKEKYVVVSGNGRGDTKYMYAAPIIMDSIAFPEEGEEIVLDTEDVVFSLPWKTLVDAMKMASILLLPEIAITGDGVNIFIEALDNKNDTSNNYKKELGKTGKTFSFIFKTENIILHPGNYDVAISKAGATRFTGQDMITYITIEESSTFGDT